MQSVGKHKWGGKVEMQRKYKVNQNTCNKKYVWVQEVGDKRKLILISYFKDYETVLFIYGIVNVIAYKHFMKI